MQTPDGCACGYALNEMSELYPRSENSHKTRSRPGLAAFELRTN